MRLAVPATTILALHTLVACGTDDPSSTGNASETSSGSSATGMSQAASSVATAGGAGPASTSDGATTGAGGDTTTSGDGGGGGATTSGDGGGATAGTGGGATTGAGGGGGGEPGSCLPVRKYVYTLGQTVSLDCVPGNAQKIVFAESIPDSGRVLVRVNLDLVGVGDSSYGVHGWSGNIDPGDPSFDRIINFGAGEDLCPGEALTRRMLGYGELTAAFSDVTFRVHQYRDTACQNGVITVAPGSTMEVWVEDPADACVGRSIVATSYFRTIWDAFGSGANMPIGMTTSFADVVSATLSTDAPATLHVMSQLEMSPSATSNQCGNRFETGVAALTRAGSYLAIETGGYPQSGGQTHLLLGPELFWPDSPPGTEIFGIAAAVNQLAQAGALVGTTSSGDTVVAIVAETP